MKRICFALGAGFAWSCLAVAASETPRFVSADGQLIMTFKGSQYQPVSPTVSRFILTGGIHVTAKKKNVEIGADHATAFVVSDAKAKTSYVKTLHAESNVTISKHTTGKGSSTIRSSQADYKGGPGQASADFSGAVTLTDNSSSRRTIQATGSSGHAVFSAGLDSKGSALKSATLRGSVTVHVDQAAVGVGKAGKLTVNCENLVYTPSAAGGQLVLSGNIHMVGTEGIVSGTMDNLAKATVHLNNKGESTTVTTGS